MNDEREMKIFAAIGDEAGVCGVGRSQAEDDDTIVVYVENVDYVEPVVAALAELEIKHCKVEVLTKRR